MNFIRASVSTVVVLLPALVSGCADNANSQAPKPQAPATLSRTAAKETELLTITLSPDAERRLGIALQAAAASESSDMRRFSGEVMAPLGSNFVVASPVSGMLRASSEGIPSVGSRLEKGQPLL